MTGAGGCMFSIVNRKQNDKQKKLLMKDMRQSVFKRGQHTYILIYELKGFS